MSMTILTVDDSRTMRDMLKMALSSAGLRVIQAEDGMDGLQVLQQETPRVIITDINMPKLDGFAFLERLQGNPQVVFVTGHNEYAVMAFRTRAVDYLVKPVRRARLSQTLDKLEARCATPDREGLAALLERLAGYRLNPRAPQYADRISVEVAQQGMRLIEVAAVSHFVARGKGTIAMTEAGECLVEYMLRLLESRRPAVC
jgi:two-component system chemotaxis response regulator CheY